MIGQLPRREREVFEILCSAGDVTAAEIRDRMQDPPSYSAVRTLLSRLEAKGLVGHRSVEQTYVYQSLAQPQQVRDTALQQLVRTFFDGSAASAAAALLGLSRGLEADEVRALQAAIDQARERQT